MLQRPNCPLTSQSPVPFENLPSQSSSGTISTHGCDKQSLGNIDGHSPVNNSIHNQEHHQGHEHAHVHSEESLKQIINRLSRIEGHVRGIKTMVNESRPCPEVLVQVAAVRGALDRVARLILDEHLSECISRAVTAGNIEDEIEELKAALDRFF